MHKGLCLLTWFCNIFVWLMTKTDCSLLSLWYIRRSNWLLNGDNEKEKNTIEITVLIIKQVCKCLLLKVLITFSPNLFYSLPYLNFLNSSYSFCKFKHDRHNTINIKLILRNQSYDLCSPLSPIISRDMNTNIIIINLMT